MEEKDFALRLAQLRQNKNVSAREMSLAIGQNAGYINNIESGKMLPSLPGVFYICDYLGISESEFFDIQSNNPAKLKDIINDLKLLDDKQLDTLSTLIKGLIKK
ncbi:MAG: helix-turn-helix transcriptional regulator [Acutalibacteraceae bacterium]|nr:helix-turn-helix transcriptional regulator [Acutalibacteraceae bacterium]